MEHRNEAESELSLHTLDLQPPVTKGHSRSPMQSACSHIQTCVVRVKNYVQFRSAMLLSKKTKNNRSIGFVILAKSDQFYFPGSDQSRILNLIINNIQSGANS